MKTFVLVLLICELAIDIGQANDDILLLDFFSSTSMDTDGPEAQPNNSSLPNSSDQFEIVNSNGFSTNSTNLLGNLVSNQNNEAISKTANNFKLKKQKLIFGKKLLLWKRNTQRGYGAFLMLCEPDIACVTPQTKLAIANCMNTGGSSLANQLYNSCSNQNRIQCTDQDVARRLLGCLRLQSANNILITPQSRACVRQVVTLGTLDCFVRILRQKPKYRLGTRYSVSTDAGAVTAAGIMGENNVDGVEDPDGDMPSGGNGRKLAKREANYDSFTGNLSFIEFFDDNETSKDSIQETAHDPIELVTLNYDEDMFSDLNRTFLNDTFSDPYYGEASDSYDPINEIVMDFKSNTTSNGTSGEEDEFEEAIDGEEDDESVPISSVEISTTNPIARLINQTETSNQSEIVINQNNYQYNSNLINKGQSSNKHVHRWKRQCRHNRRHHNRRWRPRDRSGRSNRRSHYDHYREDRGSSSFKGEDIDDVDDRKWELVNEKRRG